MRRRLRRLLTLGTVLAVSAVVVPDSAVHQASTVLVRVDTAQGVDHPRSMVWILALGSDARPGQGALHERSDAIQMVGLNLRTGTGADIGIPRDSWVPIPGHGSDRVNAALTYGGPALAGRVVGDLVGIQPDYVMLTTFPGLRAIVRSIGGITVYSRFDVRDDNMPGHVHRGRNRLNGAQALFLSRARHLLPRGDFDRSHDQQEVLRGILREVRARQSRPGFMERAVLTGMQNVYTNLSPVAIYRLAQAAASVDPARFRGCVVNGTIGDVNGASIVFPDRAMARRLGNDARRTGRLPRSC